MASRKLLILTTGLDQGGAEALLVDFAFLARDSGWTIEIMSLIPGGFHRPALEAAGFSITDAGMERSKSSVPALLHALSLVRRSEADLVQCWMYHANLIGAVAGLPIWLKRRPTFLGSFNSMMDFTAYNPLTYRVFRWGARLSRWVDGVVYNGARAARDHENAGYRADKTIVIGNGINFCRFKPDPAARAQVRRDLSVAPGAKVLVIAARNDPQKDWPTMLDVVRRLEGVTVLAAGLGTENLPETPNLMRLGPRENIERIYAASDAFMLASRFGEGTSVAMCEAMATGLPAIVTDVGDNAAMVDGGAGAVVPSGDAEAAAKAVQAILDDPVGRAKISALAVKRITATCSPRAAFSPLLAAYDKALLGRRAPIKTGRGPATQ